LIRNTDIRSGLIYFIKNTLLTMMHPKMKNFLIANTKTPLSYLGV